mmetsp:Transcript_63377/g.165984  ORF Transcript_63377/g.165984 Transcript_63377/m.165984 type:complete len:419 (-) Transcript_63377:326-1582(-)
MINEDLAETAGSPRGHRSRSRVLEDAVLGLDRQELLAGRGLLHAADDLRLHGEGLGDVYDRLRRRHVLAVELHAVPTVEDLVHLLPRGLRLLLDETEDRRRRQQAVLHHVQARAQEVEDLGLGAAAAVDHAVDLVAQAGLQDLLDDGRVRPRGRQHELPSVQLGRRLHLVLEQTPAAVCQVLRHHRVEGLRELHPQGLREDVVPRRGQAVAADAAVVARLVSRLAVRGQADNDVAVDNVAVVDDLGPGDLGGDRGVHDDGADEVADVGGLTAGEDNADAVALELLDQLLGTVDQGTDDLTRDQVLVAADGGGQEDVVDTADAEQVVQVHHDGVLRDALPDAQVARLPPVHVRQGGLGARPVGVHDDGLGGVVRHRVRHHLAEGAREEALVDVLDGRVHVALVRRNAAGTVARSVAGHG